MIKTRLLRSFAVFAILLTPKLGWSLGRVQFGPEFTFFNQATGTHEGRERVVERMRSHLVEGQPEGEKFSEIEIHDHPSPVVRNSLSLGRFTSPEGWWFEWGHDDGVIEIKTIPGDVEYFRSHAANMQDAIFSSAANEGFFPALWTGGGHINLGTTAFEGNDLLLRNFVVDMVINHNELFLGIFNHDTNNAVSLSLQAESVREQFLEVIEAFDRGEFSGEDSQLEFLDALQDAMDSAPDEFFQKWKSLGNYEESAVDDPDSTRWTYFALNFSHVSKEPWSRIEIRAVRPQKNMDMWIRQIDLIYHRLLYLERIHAPIPIQPRVHILPIEIEGPAQHHLNPPVDPEEALRSFYKFVTESGEKWENHRDYMWPQWTNPGDAREHFENSSWFHEQEVRLSCESELQPPSGGH